MLVNNSAPRVATVSTGEDENVRQISYPGYFDNGVSRKRQYSYRIVAVKDGTDSEPSNTVTISTHPDWAPLTGTPRFTTRNYTTEGGDSTTLRYWTNPPHRAFLHPLNMRTQLKQVLYIGVSDLQMLDEGTRTNRYHQGEYEFSPDTLINFPDRAPTNWSSQKECEPSYGLENAPYECWPDPNARFQDNQIVPAVGASINLGQVNCLEMEFKNGTREMVHITGTDAGIQECIDDLNQWHDVND